MGFIDWHILPEIIDSGKNGLLVPRADPQAIANAIQQLSDAGLRNRLGRNAKETVRSKYRQEVMIQKIEVLL